VTVAVVAVVVAVVVVVVVANEPDRLFAPVQMDYIGFWPDLAYIATHLAQTETDLNYREDLESSCGDHPKVPRENLKYNYSYKRVTLLANSIHYLSSLSIV
jgi:hypothetical protein